MKALYYCTMTVLLICMLSNAYCLLILHHSHPFLKIVNIITPVVVLFYLASVIQKRKKLLKRKNEQGNLN